MVDLTIREVSSRKDRRAWEEFVYDHYDSHRHYVPPLLMDERSCFDPRKNPAFEVCDVRMFLAEANGRPVGRICGIINRLEAEKVGHRVGRFGWFESTDDLSVAHGLFDRVRAWQVAEGCTELIGPFGFTDLDPSGLLIEGHDLTPTIAASYNYPYYANLVESYGFKKQVDYVEFRLDLTEPVPLLERLRERIDPDHEYVVDLSSRKEFMAQIDEVWELLEETYEHLYGFVPMSAGQRRFYTEKYGTFVDPDFVEMARGADGRLAGVIIGMPNVSQGFRRAGGRLFPFGWWHILREYRKPATVDLLLAAVHPDYPTDVLSAVGLIRIYETLRRRGVRYLETNRELETNTSVNRIWRRFKIVGTRRARLYRLELSAG